MNRLLLIIVALLCIPVFTKLTQACQKNGTPLEGAHIEVYSGDEYVRYVRIDEEGRFSFILYGDYDYSIEALDYIDEIKGRSQRMKIPQGNSDALKLVIQRIKR